MLTGQRAAAPQLIDGAFKHHQASCAPGPGAQVDDVVGDLDGLRLVLHDQHGVSLVTQLQQQVVHPLDVVGVEADRRLIEDIGDVGERGAEMSDHLGALCLTARQRARRPI